MPDAVHGHLDPAVQARPEVRRPGQRHAQRVGQQPVLEPGVVALPGGEDGDPRAPLAGRRCRDRQPGAQHRHRVPRVGRRQPSDSSGSAARALSRLARA